ncbi:MAG: hypothetical protein ACJAR1_000360 [Rubritalea sp.]|jgi:hypothetical protein
MMSRKDIPFGFTVLVLASLALTQCAVQEVKQELSESVERKGASFAHELSAQSPFKKVEMSWREASELMKERNSKYRQAIIDKEESLIKRGLVNNLTFEVRKSLNGSVQTTLNPSAIAKAMKDPVASLPGQLESITDLKNIYHSLTQSEWGRILQSVRADAAQRREMVNLHVLFCQSENLEKAESNLESLIVILSADGSMNLNKAMTVELAKTQAILKKERGQWLDQVRNFFNAEYYDVEFNNYKRKLSFYREVNNPDFSDWERWRMLENSHRLAVELQRQHGEEKPALPGINRITRNFGMIQLRSDLAQQSALNEDMVKEVRQMLKSWRNLKQVQLKIARSEVNPLQVVVAKKPSLADLKRVTIVYQLKKSEIEQLKAFWMIDEKCWEI